MGQPVSPIAVSTDRRKGRGDERPSLSFARERRRFAELERHMHMRCALITQASRAPSQSSSPPVCVAGRVCCYRCVARLYRWGGTHELPGFVFASSHIRKKKS